MIYWYLFYIDTKKLQNYFLYPSLPGVCFSTIVGNLPPL